MQDTTLVRQIKEKWGKRVPGYIDGANQREAAVLLPLIEHDGELCLLFEVRADSLRSQPGEICFPGGSIELGEAPAEAALRETMEELLLEENQIELMAPLDLLLVPANLTVYPFLGRLINYENTFSPGEVGHVFTVPISWFLNCEPDSYRTKVVTVPEDNFPFEFVPDGENYRWKQGRYDVLFYRYKDYIIWGMTAKFVHSFIQMYRRDLDK